MKVIIAGSRTIQNYSVVEQAIFDSGWADEISEVVSGASEQDVLDYMNGKRKANVDILGAVWAIHNGILPVYFPADWDSVNVPGAIIRWKNGKPYNAKAGPDRNELMAAYADALILVWTGDPKKSKGSADMLARAKTHGLSVHTRIVQHAAQ